MPHISKKKVHKLIKEKVDSRFFSLLMEEGSYVRKKVFLEIFTNTEKIMIMKRIALLLLISKKMSLYKISKLLGMSTSTIKRFQNSKEVGKYNETLKWLNKMHIEDRLIKNIVNLIKIPFETRGKSLSQIFKEA